MGASVDTRTIKDASREDLKKLFENATEEARYNNGNSGYTGTIAEMSSIGSFVDKEYDSAFEAEDYIVDNHDKWDQAMAVSYLRKGQKCWLVGGWCSE